jgi:hypothetical protein
MVQRCSCGDTYAGRISSKDGYGILLVAATADPGQALQGFTVHFLPQCCVLFYMQHASITAVSL